jgi:hypothetical protein
MKIKRKSSIPNKPFIYGFILLEQTIASIILSLFILEFNQLQFYFITRQKTLEQQIKINQINSILLGELTSIAKYINSNDISLFSFTEQNYQTATNKINICNNSKCNIVQFLTQTINNWHYNLQQLSGDIFSIICQDTPPYQAPNKNSPNCTNSGDIVLKILWLHLNEPYTNVIKIQ